MLRGLSHAKAVSLSITTCGGCALECTTKTMPRTPSISLAAHYTM